MFSAALIGFAGPRVIEQTIHQKLPKGFQRAEFLLEHGFIDDIVKRENLKETLGKILTFHEKEDLVPGQNQLECSHIGNAPFLSASIITFCMVTGTSMFSSVPDGL